MGNVFLRNDATIAAMKQWVTSAGVLSVVVSMETNRRHYFHCNICMYSYFLPAVRETTGSVHTAL